MLVILIKTRVRTGPVPGSGPGRSKTVRLHGSFALKSRSFSLSKLCYKKKSDTGHYMAVVIKASVAPFVRCRPLYNDPLPSPPRLRCTQDDCQNSHIKARSHMAQQRVLMQRHSHWCWPWWTATYVAMRYVNGPLHCILMVTTHYDVEWSRTVVLNAAEWSRTGSGCPNFYCTSADWRAKLI